MIYYPRTCTMVTVPLVAQYLKIIPTMVKSAVQLDCYLYFLSEIGIYRVYTWVYTSWWKATSAPVINLC